MSARDRDPLLHAIASVALRYPDEDVVAQRDELVALGDELGRSRAADRLRAFLGWWTTLDPLALRQAYVDTFDLHKRCSLYLTYYLYGDRRQRGQEFVRLKRLYEAAGFRLADRELPDYLPLVLEFAALEPAGGRDVLADLQVPLELLRAALADASSPWAGVVDAVAAGLPALDDAGRNLMGRLAADGPPSEQVGLEPYGAEPFGPPEAMPASPTNGAPPDTTWAVRR